MQARMKFEAKPEVFGAINTLVKAVHSAGVAPATLELVHLRASQINGCSWCVNSGAHSAKAAGETDERLFTVAAWRETDYFTGADGAVRAVSPSRLPVHQRRSLGLPCIPVRGA
jgi:AhpD family alkylhydroperoxidase